MENNNRLQMDGIQNEKNTKWSKIKQIMLKELMNFAVVIVIFSSCFSHREYCVSKSQE